MKTIFLALAFALISACSTFDGLFGPDVSPADQWAKQQGIYNALAQTAINGRRPCVTEGSDSPNCLFDDATFAKINHFSVAADGYLKAADAHLRAGDDDKFKFYLSAAVSAMDALRANISGPGGGGESPIPVEDSR